MPDLQFGDGVVIGRHLCSHIPQHCRPFVPILPFLSFGTDVNDVDSVIKPR